MKINKLKEFTLNKIIFYDMILNFFLGFGFIFFYKNFEKLISPEKVLPVLIWRLIGIGFIFFAGWQTKVLSKKNINSKELIFASLMALIPVIMLSYALIFMNFNLYLWSRIVFWIGNIYMLILGSWYMFLAIKLRKIK
jgi:hypothetical protein